MKDQQGISVIAAAKIDNPLDSNLSSPGRIETPAREVEELFEKMEAYGKTTFELAKLKSLEVTTNVVTSLVSRFVVVVMITFFLLFLSLGLSVWLGEIMERSFYGYYIMAGFFLIVALLFYWFLHPFMRKTLGQDMITQALE